MSSSAGDGGDDADSGDVGGDDVEVGDGDDVEVGDGDDVEGDAGSDVDGEEGPPGFKVIDVAAGAMHTCILDEAGEVHCWGEGFSGQIDPPEGERFKQLTAGSDYTCGLRGDGRAICWGNVDTWAETTPGVSFKFISGGDFHVCGLTHGDEVKCWGSYAGEDPEGVFKAISSGFGYSCGLTRVERAVVCWGEIPRYFDESPEYPEELQGPFEAISVGEAHGCVLNGGGAARCWGGTGVSGESTVPTGVTFQEVVCGADRTCGVKVDGGLICWGLDMPGRPSPGDVRLHKLSSGALHMCGLSEGGEVYCWGVNSHGQVDVPEEFR